MPHSYRPADQGRSKLRGLFAFQKSYASCCGSAYHSVYVYKATLSMHEQGWVVTKAIELCAADSCRVMSVRESNKGCNELQKIQRDQQAPVLHRNEHSRARTKFYCL
jgi:hypothetical protein